MARTIGRLAIGILLVTAWACGSGAVSAPTRPSSTTLDGSTNAVSVATTWTCFTAPSAGIFAASGCGISAATRVGSRGSAAGVAAPTAPVNLTASVIASTVTITWQAPVTGDVPTSYVIEAGGSPGVSNIASFDTGSIATSFSVGGVQSGSYYVRVRARNNSGTSAPSNEILLTVGVVTCSAPPGSPINLAAAVNMSSVTLTWTAPMGPITSYVLEAGSAIGLSNLVNSDLGTSAATLTATGVGVGTYYVRVRAKNACGTSGASNEVVATVAGGFRAGSWSYALSVSVPLNATPIMSCVAQSSGTTIVSSSGTFSIPFSVACDACAESGTITGTITPTSVSGSVTASISGPISGPGGCSIQQPTPSPAAMAGTCNSAGCTVSTGSNLNPNLSFAVSYTLTPP